MTQLKQLIKNLLCINSNNYEEIPSPLRPDNRRNAIYQLRRQHLSHDSGMWDGRPHLNDLDMIGDYISTNQYLHSHLRSSLLDLNDYIRSSLSSMDITNMNLKNELYKLYYKNCKPLPTLPIYSESELENLEFALTQLEDIINNMRLTTIIEEPEYLDSPIISGITNLTSSFILGPILINNNKFNKIIKWIIKILVRLLFTLILLNFINIIYIIISIISAWEYLPNNYLWSLISFYSPDYNKELPLIPNSNKDLPNKPLESETDSSSDSLYSNDSIYTFTSYNSSVSEFIIEFISSINDVINANADLERLIEEMSNSSTDSLLSFIPIILLTSNKSKYYLKIISLLFWFIKLSTIFIVKTITFKLIILITIISLFWLFGLNNFITEYIDFYIGWMKHIYISLKHF
jgi:hypothetical protein